MKLDHEVVNHRFLEIVDKYGSYTVSERAGISRHSISRYRKDSKSLPHIGVVYKLCLAYEVPLVWLLGMTDQYPEYDFAYREIDHELIADRIEFIKNKHYYGIGKWMAVAGGVSEAALSSYLREENKYPSLDFIYGIAMDTRKSPDWMLGLVDYVPKKQKVTDVDKYE